MNTKHKHRVVRESEPYGYRGSVSRDENRAAHGGICVTQYCSCGAERRENSNGRHVETGVWYVPDTAVRS